MSGILDSKSRVIDAIITIEGRRQLAAGKLDISYATFTDASTAYLPDSESGHEDPTKKIYFEACNLPQDQVTFEADDSGNLVPFRSQDIKLATPGNNVPSSYAEGSLVNGKLLVRQYHHGRLLKAEYIKETPSDKGKGFIYSSLSGLTASILIDPSLISGKYVASSAPPYSASIGTRGGIPADKFVQIVSSAISDIRTSGGPNVNVEAINDSLFFDTNDEFLNTQLYATGTLSSPLQLQEGSIGGNLLVDELRGSTFASQIEGILTSSFDNFVKLQTIATVDRLFEDDQFLLSGNEIEFNLSRIKPENLNLLRNTTPTLNSIDSLFSDEKMSHLDNFLYLPPIVKTSDSILPDKSKVENLTPYLLGDYPSWGDNEKKLTFSKLQTQLGGYENPKVITFTSTSMKNNIIGQIFEVTGDKVRKLDVVDFGDIKNDAREPTATSDRVFFAGKVFQDDRGTTCFVNMFTLIFSKIPRPEDGK